MTQMNIPTKQKPSLTHVENRRVNRARGVEVRKMNLEIRIGIYTLPCIKQIAC